jgi:hypothetical protein
LKPTSWCLDLHFQRPQSQRIFPPALPQGADRVAYRLARVLILARPDQTLDKFILLSRHADVPGRHIQVLPAVREPAIPAEHVADLTRKALEYIPPSGW